MLPTIVIGYLKLSLVCALIMAAIAVYDTRRYPFVRGVCPQSVHPPTEILRPSGQVPTAWMDRHLKSALKQQSDPPGVQTLAGVFF